MVKHADSQYKGCEFECCMCHNKNAIGEEGNGKPPHESTSLERTQSPVAGFCYARNRVCNRVLHSIHLAYFQRISKDRIFAHI